MKTKINIEIATATGAMTVYSLLRKALAPTLTAEAISIILAFPGSCLLTEMNRTSEYRRATAATPAAIIP